MQISLLGPVEVSEGDQQIPLTGQQRRALLAALALSYGRVVPIARLVDALWDVKPPATARMKVQGHVSALRQAFGPQSRDVLRTRSPGYILGPHGVELDVTAFEDLARRGGAAAQSGDPAVASELFAAALALWRGHACTDVNSPLIQAMAGALEDRHLLAIEAKAEADLILGRYETVVMELSAALSSCPLRERLRGQLMLALYRLGCRADALSLYRDGRQAMVDELGLEPGAQLRRLHQRLLADDPGLHPPGRRARPAGALGAAR